MNKRILTRFREFAKAKGIDFDSLSQLERDALFEHFSAWVAIKHWHLEDFHPTQTDSVVVGGLFDHQLDAVAVILKDQLIETAEQFEQLASQPDSDALRLVFVQSTVSNHYDLHKMQVFVNGALMFLENESFFRTNEKLQRQRDLSAAIIEQFPDDEKASINVFIYFISMLGVEKEEVNAQWRAWAESSVRKAGFPNVTVEGINEERFEQCLDRLHVPDVPKLASAVEDYECAIPASTMMEVAMSQGGVATSYIGCISATNFISLLERPDGQGIRDAVFTENVRGFKGIDTAVNQAISQTIQDPESHHQFFLRNNGITIVAEQASFNDGVLTLKNYQIVNGLQTSHVLYHHRHSLTESSDFLLVVKVAVTNDPVIKDAIIEGTNRQTSVDDLEFLSRHPILREIESYFEECRNRNEGPPLYLERRSGQFYSASDVPELSIVTPQDLMLAYAAAFLDTPHESKLGPARVLKRIPASIFASDHSPERYHLTAWMLYIVRSYREKHKIANRPIIDWHLVFCLRHFLNPAPISANSSAEDIAAFNRKLKEKLTQTRLVNRRLKTSNGIIKGILNWRSSPKAKTPTDFLALSKTTKSLKAQIHNMK